MNKTHVYGYGASSRIISAARLCKITCILGRRRLLPLKCVYTACYSRGLLKPKPNPLQAEEVREVMEAEMRTQLRRQAAAHTDHLRDVLGVQEQELKAEFQQVSPGLGAGR